MYSQLYSTDLDKFKIWEVQTVNKPTEDYVTMDDYLDGMLVEAVNELAAEKPADDEVVVNETVVEDGRGDDDVVVVGETSEDEAIADEIEEPPPVSDASMQTETEEEKDLGANEQGGANLPLLPSTGE